MMKWVMVLMLLIGPVKGSDYDYSPEQKSAIDVSNTELMKEHLAAPDRMLDKFGETCSDAYPAKDYPEGYAQCIAGRKLILAYKKGHPEIYLICEHAHAPRVEARKEINLLSSRVAHCVVRWVDKNLWLTSVFMRQSSTRLNMDRCIQQHKTNVGMVWACLIRLEGLDGYDALSLIHI